MGKKQKNAISPSRSEDYPEWYQQVIKAADLAEISPVRGCMVIKPWGWSIWENMQRVLDGMFKDTGHENAYFPLFIPMSYLEKEAEHVEGFAKECAVVTHHRLEPDPEGGLRPAGPLEEPLIVRPTSETIIGEMYSRWIQSYRDLPILINQWANVVRWELRTRMFLRTTEFLWQEGHTAHATEEEAWEETRKMLHVYGDFAEQTMAMPVIRGEKTVSERFPGAVATYSIEAMMQDGKALQSGTSHFLGQNFARAQNINFQDQNGEEVFAWTTSWGASTRLIGALIMTHSDDDGLVLPPRLAPKHVVLLPIYRNDEERSQVIPYCEELKSSLSNQTFGDGQKVIVHLDDRDMRGGEKNWQHVKRGVPLRVEVGPRDIANNATFVGRRDTGTKQGMPREELIAQVGSILDEMQNGMFARALAMQKERTTVVRSLDELKEYFQGDGSGFAIANFVDKPEIDEILKPLKVTPRCIPVDEEMSTADGDCIFTGNATQKRAVFAKSY